MKILVVSNFYPPHHIGGYELGCRDVVDGLLARGHHVEVLTSTYGVSAPLSDGHIHRRLASWLRRPVGRVAEWKAMVSDEIQNQAALRDAVRRFSPDLIYVWNVGFTTLSLANVAESLGPAVAYYVSDQWPKHWKDDPTYSLMRARRKLPLRMARTLVAARLKLAGVSVISGPPKLRFPQFTSDFIRTRVEAAGYIPEQSFVIPWGIEIDRFKVAPGNWPPRKILFTGQLNVVKGVHTAIDAFAKVAKSPAVEGITLTLVGGATFNPEYEVRLRNLATELGVADRVIFRGQLPREELPGVFADHDVYLFPSEWDEPFSISLVEGLASGLAVVSTTTGGSPEIVRNDDNALTYTAKDSAECARQLERVLTNRELYDQLRTRGRETVLAKYGFNTMLDSIEHALQIALTRKS